MNIEQAEKWLAIYKESNPDNECKFSDVGFLVDQDKIDAQKALVDEVSKELDKE